VLSLSIKVSVFQEEGYVKLGSRKFAVDTGKLAITYTILDWPFDSYDNTLVVRTSIETPSAGGSMSGSELFLFNGASWTFAPTAAIPAPYDSVCLRPPPIVAFTLSSFLGLPSFRYYSRLSR
jgi:hypothetical protein